MHQVGCKEVHEFHWPNVTKHCDVYLTFLTACIAVERLYFFPEKHNWKLWQTTREDRNIPEIRSTDENVTILFGVLHVYNWRWMRVRGEKVAENAGWEVASRFWWFTSPTINVIRHSLAHHWLVLLTTRRPKVPSGASGGMEAVAL